MMNIEEALQQTKPFKSVFQKAIVNIMYTSNWLEERLRLILKPYEITIQQYNVLRILRGANKTISTSCIRQRLIDRMSDTSRMVDRLYKKGLVDKVPSLGDKRKVDISLTDSGSRLLAEIDKANFKFEQCVKALSQEEAQILNDLLDKMRLECELK